MGSGDSAPALGGISKPSWIPERPRFGPLTNPIPGVYWPYFLPVGLLAIVAAQLMFNLGPGQGLPVSGVFAVLAGIGAVAQWTALIGKSRIPDHPVINVSGPALAQPFSGLRDAGLVIGSVTLVILLYRVLSGAGTVLDIALWLMTIAAFAAMFVPGEYRNRYGTALASLPARLLAMAKARWRGYLPLLAIIVIYCALTMPNLTAWRYASVGDEYVFYEHATRALVFGSDQPFSQNGVYGNNPEFNTIYKAALMRVFGEDHFGWKMTGVVSMALSIAGIYALGGLFGGRAAAVGAAGLFAASHYLLGLLHGGYNHLDALPVTIWALTAFVAGLRGKNPLLLFLAGALVGLGFYFHYAARITGPIMLLTGLLAVRPREYLRLWPVIPGFMLMIWPTLLLAQEEILTKMLAETAGGYAEEVAGPTGARLLSNLKTNLPAIFYNETSHTYVGGPLLDPVTGTLAAVGVGLAIGTLGRLSSRLCLLWMVIAFAATGLLSPYPATAITRLFPIIAPLALLAGLALANLPALTLDWQRYVQGRLVKIAAPIALATLVVAVFWINAHQSISATHAVFHYTSDALVVGAIRSDHCGNRPDRTLIVGAHPLSTLNKALGSYDPGGQEVRVAQFEEFNADLLPPGPSCAVFPNPNTREAHRAMVELQDRFPRGTFYTITTPSRKNTVEYFHRPAT